MPFKGSVSVAGGSSYKFNTSKVSNKEHTMNVENNYNANNTYNTSEVSNKSTDTEVMVFDEQQNNDMSENLNTDVDTNNTNVDLQNTSIFNQKEDDGYNAYKSIGLNETDIERLKNKEITFDDLITEILCDDDNTRRKRLYEGLYIHAAGLPYNSLEELDAAISSMSDVAQYRKNHPPVTGYTEEDYNSDMEAIETLTNTKNNIENSLNYYFEHMDLYEHNVHKADFEENSVCVFTEENCDIFNREKKLEVNSTDANVEVALSGVVQAGNQIGSVDSANSIGTGSFDPDAYVSSSSQSSNTVEFTIDDVEEQMQYLSCMFNHVGDFSYNERIKNNYTITYRSSDSFFNDFQLYMDKGLVTEEQVRIFNYIYNAEGAEAAKGYLLSIYEYMQNEYEQYQLGELNEFVDGSFANRTVASILSVLITPYESLMILNYSLDRLLCGGEITKTGTFSYGNAFRGLVSSYYQKTYGNAASTVYDYGMTINDVLFGSLINNLCPFAPPLFNTLYLMGPRVYQPVLREALERGATDSQAVVYAMLCGLIEAGTEAVSLGSFLEIGTDAQLNVLLKTVAKKFPNSVVLQETTIILYNLFHQALVEAGEEVTSSVASDIVSAFILGENSSFTQDLEKYMSEGYSRDDAIKKVLKDSFINSKEDAFAGFVTGFILGGGATAVNAPNINSELINSRVSTVIEYYDKGDISIEDVTVWFSANNYKQQCLLLDKLNNTQVIEMLSKSNNPVVILECLPKSRFDDIVSDPSFKLDISTYTNYSDNFGSPDEVILSIANNEEKIKAFFSNNLSNNRNNITSFLSQITQKESMDIILANYKDNPVFMTILSSFVENQLNNGNYDVLLLFDSETIGDLYLTVDTVFDAYNNGNISFDILTQIIPVLDESNLSSLLEKLDTNVVIDILNSIDDSSIVYDHLSDDKFIDVFDYNNGLTHYDFTQFKRYYDLVEGKAVDVDSAINSLIEKGTFLDFIGNDETLSKENLMWLFSNITSKEVMAKVVDSIYFSNDAIMEVFSEYISQQLNKGNYGIVELLTDIESGPMLGIDLDFDVDIAKLMEEYKNGDISDSGMSFLLRKGKPDFITKVFDQLNVNQISSILGITKENQMALLKYVPEEMVVDVITSKEFGLSVETYVNNYETIGVDIDTLVSKLYANNQLSSLGFLAFSSEEDLLSLFSMIHNKSTMNMLLSNFTLLNPKVKNTLSLFVTQQLNSGNYEVMNLIEYTHLIGLNIDVSGLDLLQLYRDGKMDVGIVSKLLKYLDNKESFINSLTVDEIIDIYTSNSNDSLYTIVADSILSSFSDSVRNEVINNPNFVPSAYTLVNNQSWFGELNTYILKLNAAGKLKDVLVQGSTTDVANLVNSITNKYIMNAVFMNLSEEKISNCINELLQRGVLSDKINLIDDYYFRYVDLVIPINIDDSTINMENISGLSLKEFKNVSLGNVSKNYLVELESFDGSKSYDYVNKEKTILNIEKGIKNIKLIEVDGQNQGFAKIISDKLNKFKNLINFKQIFNSNNKYGGNQNDVARIMDNYIEVTADDGSVDYKKFKILKDLIIKYYGENVSSINYVNIATAYANNGCGYMSIANTILLYYDSIENGAELFKEKFGYDMYLYDENGNKSYNFEAIAFDLYLYTMDRRYESFDDYIKSISVDNQGVNGTVFEMFSDFFAEKGIDADIQTVGINDPKDITQWLNAIANTPEGYVNVIGSANYFLSGVEGEVGPHAVVVTGIDADGNIKVSSWSGEHTFSVPIEDFHEYITSDGSEKENTFGWLARIKINPEVEFDAVTSQDPSYVDSDNLYVDGMVGTNMPGFGYYGNNFSNNYNSPNVNYYKNLQGFRLMNLDVIMKQYKKNGYNGYEDFYHAYLADYGNNASTVDIGNKLSAYYNEINCVKRYGMMCWSDEPFTHFLRGSTPKTPLNNSIKIYIPTDGVHDYNNTRIIIDYLLANDYNFDSKIRHRVSNDGIVIRVEDYNKAMQLINFINNNNNIVVNSQGIPLAMRIGKASIAMDGNGSYNSITAAALEAYINSTDNPTTEGFNKFINNLLNEVMVNGNVSIIDKYFESKLINIKTRLKGGDYRYDSLPSAYVNIIQILKLLSISSNPNATVQDYLNQCLINQNQHEFDQLYRDISIDLEFGGKSVTALDAKNYNLSNPVNLEDYLFNVKKYMDLKYPGAKSLENYVTNGAEDELTRDYNIRNIVSSFDTNMLKAYYVDGISPADYYKNLLKPNNYNFKNSEDYYRYLSNVINYLDQKYINTKYSGIDIIRNFLTSGNITWLPEDYNIRAIVSQSNKTGLNQAYNNYIFNNYALNSKNYDFNNPADIKKYVDNVVTYLDAKYKRENNGMNGMSQLEGYLDTGNSQLLTHDYDIRDALSSLDRNMLRAYIYKGITPEDYFKNPNLRLKRTQLNSLDRLVGIVKNLFKSKKIIFSYDNSESILNAADTIYNYLKNENGIRGVSIAQTQYQLHNYYKNLVGKTSLTNAAFWPNSSYFLNFNIGVEDTSKPLYNSFKIYIPTDGIHDYKNMSTILDYLIEHNIASDNKIGGTARRDGIVLRIYDYEDARQVINFINSNSQIVTNGESVPYAPKVGKVSLAMDGFTSYNTISSYALLAYLNENPNGSTQDFSMFIDNLLNNVLVKGNLSLLDQYFAPELTLNAPKKSLIDRLNGDKVQAYANIVQVLRLLNVATDPIQITEDVFNQCLENQNQQEYIKLCATIRAYMNKK